MPSEPVLKVRLGLLKPNAFGGQSPLGVAKTWAFSKLRFSGVDIHVHKSLSKVGHVSNGLVFKQALTFSRTPEKRRSSPALFVFAGTD